MKGSKTLASVVLALLLLLGASVVLLRTMPSAQAEPLTLRRLFTAATPDPHETLNTLTLPAPEREAQSEAGRLLLEAWETICAADPVGEMRIEGDAAEQTLRVATLDIEGLTPTLTGRFAAAQEQWVAKAGRAGEVYNEDRTVREELPRGIFTECLRELLEGNDYALTQEVTLRLKYADKVWTPENGGEIDAWLLGPMNDADAAAEAVFAAAYAALPYLPKVYTIPEDALAGPVPDPAGFGETDDPAVIEALLQRPEARALIGEESLVWNAGIERFPGSVIRYYLDESLLVLVWQEVEAREVGTFSEVFIADGSQLRRKISGDELWSFAFETTSRFARDTNAVLALGGDFYYHGRNCGISVYQREMFRFEPVTCDVCYITSDGDMLFSYRNQFETEDEARQFIRDNDVIFSLGFGPVLIDDGVDVMPEQYQWGEIWDEYARSALGMLGRHHYLTMNLNCGQGQYYYLATLRQAADAMLKRGCVKAYTLDGGQTATTVFNGQLINPVQFGVEKDISDIIYFATAIPNG